MLNIVESIFNTGHRPTIFYRKKYETKSIQSIDFINIDFIPITRWDITKFLHLRFFAI